MSEYLQGVSLAFRIPEEENFSEDMFLFEHIENCLSVEEIPKYSFELERRVKQEIFEFREEMEIRSLHLMYQRRPQQTRRSQQPGQTNSPPGMPRAASTPLAATSTPNGLAPRPSAAIVHFDSDLNESDNARQNGHGLLMDRVSPDTIKTRLPAIRKPEEPKPVSSRIKSLFRSKTRTSPKA
ncbi:hypothetical protein LPJ78_001235 [Coemansia sp. RSA 989]|nr:hypothetical protein LPJ68_000692 [Coemansia sp. RSA 1086]KAJ1752579.1 hypothetical protein LPJ79_001099 [Coemansia sp. RSA 1821]KAJ1867144.1 hypothetical protein LPJ78_001235 [Coemansia sp. RSA 989]KAJ1874020.1 hypothetical protein LPJ55_001834 [Coemansia sp. RSA 990]KAJ2649039.1 hypothetical protein IWW40_003450 [Coemansia sp. RSA 1250]KAJ2671753.1 hypothetical protein IWW42_003212 [Coemansia sp. RSA 1085]